MVELVESFYSTLKQRNYENLSLRFMVIDSAYHETALPTIAAQGSWWLFKK